jgi:HlyD family secretion protein
MDISRPDLKKQRERRRMIWGAVAVVVVGVATFFLLHLKPAIPTVDAAVWTDTVKRGPLLR